MTRSHGRAGLSLVEVLIALAVLAIGIVALANLQASSLQYTSRAEELRTVTQIAEAELEWRRQTQIRPDRVACESTIPDGFACSVEIIPVGALGNDITVTVTSRGADIQLSAFTTGQRYISGQEPDFAGIIDEPGDGSGGGTGSDPVVDPGDGSDPDPTPCVTKGKGKGKGNAC